MHRTGIPESGNKLVTNKEDLVVLRLDPGGSYHGYEILASTSSKIRFHINLEWVLPQDMAILQSE